MSRPAEQGIGRSTIWTLPILVMLVLLVVTQEAQSQTVYITKSGEKYHKEGCRYLSKSKIKTSLSEAQQNGYTSCSVCKPVTRSSTNQPNVTAVPKTTLPKPTTSRQCTAMTESNKRCSRLTMIPVESVGNINSVPRSWNGAGASRSAVPSH